LNPRKLALALPFLSVVCGCQNPSGLRPVPALASPRWLIEKNLLFYPKVYPEGDWETIPDHFQEVWFESPDGVRLHGYFVEAPKARAVLLYCHGNGGNVSTRVAPVRYLTEKLGLTVFLFDYRGYGKSEGAPTEEGILKDARAARAWLSGKTGVKEEDLILLGNSLGGGVAVDLAARDGARALILENTFTSLPDVARWYTRGIPIKWLMKSRLDSLGKIGQYQGPLLQTHGDSDKVVPFVLGWRLHQAANEPKEFIRVLGGEHSEEPSGDYAKALGRFLDGLEPPVREP